MQFEDAFSDIASRFPIQNRVSNEEIRKVVKEELDVFGIHTPFDFAVFDGNLATSVRSSGYYMDPEKTYKVPIFVNKLMNTNYELYINFPERRKRFWVQW